MAEAYCLHVELQLEQRLNPPELAAAGPGVRKALAFYT